MENIMAVAGLFLGGAWELLTSVNFPGTNMSFAMILCGSVLVVFGLKVLRVILGSGFINTEDK
jgi:hypothetical protein